MAKVKTPNYTPEQEAELTALAESIADNDYESRKVSLQAYCDANGRKMRSVQSKMARMDIYIPKETKSKISGEEPAKKSELAAQVAKSVNQFIENPKFQVNPDNLEKVNKTDLLGLRDAFEALQPTGE